MSEERQKPRVRRAGSAGAAPQQQGQNSPLRTERGGIRIEDTVVANIAGIAVREVEGVRTGGSTSRSVGGLLGGIPGVGGGNSESRGASVEVGEVEAAVNVTATVAYGRPIPRVSEAVRRNVINRIENLVGLRVTEVNVFVNDVFFPEQERQQQRQIEQQRQAEQEQGVW